MKPGATVRSLASTVRRAGSSSAPTCTIRPPLIPTSARLGGAPVPSITVPSRIRTSSMLEAYLRPAEALRKAEALRNPPSAQRAARRARGEPRAERAESRAPSARRATEAPSTPLERSENGVTAVHHHAVPGVEIDRRVSQERPHRLEVVRRRPTPHGGSFGRVVQELLVLAGPFRQLRLGPPGYQAVAADPVAGELDCQRADERQHRRLAGRVVLLAGGAVNGAGRRHPHEGPTLALPDEDPRRLAKAVERAVEIGPQHLVPLLGGHVDERLAARRPGVRHQAVQPAEAVQGRAHRRHHLLLRGDVALDAERRAAELLQFPHRSRVAVRPPRPDRHRPSRPDYPPRDAKADTRVASGHHGNPP